MVRRLFVAALLLGACGDNIVADTTHDDAGTASTPSIDAPAYVRVVEGHSETITVKLAADPGRDLTIALRSRDGDVATVGPSVVTLSSATFATGVPVTVLGTEDDGDVANDTTDIELSIDGAVVHRIAATVIDNDVQQIVADTASLALTEGTSGSFTVRLTRQPGEMTALRVWSTAGAIATATPAMLTFSPASYATPQTVTVTTAADADTASGSARIYVGDVPGVESAYVDVAVHDPDVQALVLSAPSIAIDEGATATFTVALAYDPLTPTQVTLQSSDAGAVAITSPAALTFTSSNYSIPQTVTIGASADDDTNNENVTLTLSGPPTSQVSVVVTDDDQIIAPAGVTVAEGSSTSFTVKLANDPGPTGRVVDLQATGDVGVRDATLTFTSANYANGLPVTIDGLVDANSTSTKAGLIRVSSAGQVSRTVGVSIEQRIPGALNASTFWREAPAAGWLGWVQFDLTLSNSWPGDGQLSITLPPGYDASAAAFVSSNLDGSFTVSSDATTILVARAGGTASGTQVSLRLDNIRNPPVSGSYTLQLSTRTGSGGPLDVGTAADHIDVGYMPGGTVMLSTLQPGATGTATLTFRTTNPWPADGKLLPSFPVGFDVTGASVIAQSGVDGALTMTSPAQSWQSWTLNRSGGTTVPAGTLISITLDGVVNPATAQATTVFELVTTTALDQWIDVTFPNSVTIGCPATMTKAPLRGYSTPFGGVPWANPEEVDDSDSWSATASLLGASDFLVAHDFQFTMPAGATVTGIQFDVDRDFTGWYVVDSAVRVVKTAIGSTDLASPAQWLRWQSVTYGGSTELWGETWTAADIESSTFGLALAAEAAMPGMTGNAKVDYVTATVYLSCP